MRSLLEHLSKVFPSRNWLRNFAKPPIFLRGSGGPAMNLKELGFVYEAIVATVLFSDMCRWISGCLTVWLNFFHHQSSLVNLYTPEIKMGNPKKETSLPIINFHGLCSISGCKSNLRPSFFLSHPKNPHPLLFAPSWWEQSLSHWLKDKPSFARGPRACGAISWGRSTEDQLNVCRTDH